MTDDEERCSERVIDFCRHMNRRMAEEQERIGARRDDIAIGAIYSAVDIQQSNLGNPIAAIEWARTALDVMENNLLSGDTLQ